MSNKIPGVAATGGGTYFTIPFMTPQRVFLILPIAVALYGYSFISPN